MITLLDGQTANSCTANVVFSDERATYLGYAAHCAGAAGLMGLIGCEERTLPLGRAVFIEGRNGTRIRGVVADSSWTTMQARGETEAAPRPGEPGWSAP